MCKLKYLHLQASYSFYINIHATKMPFCFQFEFLEVHLYRLALYKSRKWLALDINKTHMCWPQNALCLILLTNSHKALHTDKPEVMCNSSIHLGAYTTKAYLY